MNADLPTYPKHKTVGGGALLEMSLPTHWGMLALKRVLSFGNGRDYKGIEVDEGGFPVYGSGGPFARASDYLHDGESVLFGRKGTVDRPLYLDCRFWTVDTMYFTRIRSDVCARFIYYVARSIPYNLYLTNTALPSMTQEVLGNHKIAAPPLEEQTQIAKFLDHETAKIDALIEQQQQLIALLEEKRQAVISHAVTRGLNPDTPMRDSDVEWLGVIPAHWEVVQMRRLLTSIEQGSSPLASSSPPEAGDTGVLKISAIKTGVFYESQAKSLDDAPFEEAYRVREGDLLVTRGNTPDLVADACVVVEEPKANLMMSDLIYRLNANDLVHPRFLCLWLLSSCARFQIKNDARGSSMTMAKVAQGHIKSWQATLPGRDEQERIVGHIAATDARTSTLLVRCESMVERLQERRTALISAAVTGKIDVRGWKPPKSESEPDVEAEVA